MSAKERKRKSAKERKRAQKLQTTRFKTTRFGNSQLPSGPEETSWCRGTKIAARQFLSLNCLAITLTWGVILEEEKMPLLLARDSLGGILGDNLGEGNCESKIVSRQWGVNSCRETSRCLAGPSGLSKVHFVLRDISALLDPSWGSWLPTLIHLVWKQ